LHTLAAASSLVLAVGASAQSFHFVGVAPGNDFTRAHAISRDGRTAAGFSSSTSSDVGFTWTAEGGRNDFGLEPGLPNTAAYGISDTGAVVGMSHVSQTPGSSRAFRYRGPGTFETLGLLTNYTRSFANGVSADGSVVVGASTDGIAGQAFRWTSETGMQPLGYGTPGHYYSEARAVSGNGQTIVGLSRGATTDDAVVWTQGSTLRLTLPENSTSGGNAYGVNFDGSVVVGAAGPNFSGTVWRHGIPTLLDLPAGRRYFMPYGVDDTGSTVVGALEGSRAGIWTPERGTELLSEYLAANGVVVPAGINLTIATAVSGDGQTITGWSATNGQGFVVTIPAPAGLALWGVVLVHHARSARGRKR